MVTSKPLQAFPCGANRQRGGVAHSFCMAGWRRSPRRGALRPPSPDELARLCERLREIGDRAA
jgi:hypothetical protein